MPVDQYIIGDVIGKGSYGEVTLATNKKDKKKYVIKKIELHNANAKERTFAQQEVEILSKLRHPNIVSYKESYQSEDGCLSIVMGYCEGGDLYTKLKKQAKQNEFLEETQIVEWFVQIAMALQYIHDRNILHRDLKTQNIFLTKSKIIKLGDLGIARVLDDNSDMATTMIGTPYYMSPELFSNKPYNHKSDVWALGCCVYEMATLKHAFNAKDMNSLVYKILKGKMPSMPSHYSDELLEIIKSMLSYDPSRRPSASRILRHHFIKKHIALFLEGTKSRHKKKSREGKTPRVKSLNEVPSPSSSRTDNISNDVNPEIIATASKVDIELVNDVESRDDKNNENDVVKNVAANDINNINIQNEEFKARRKKKSAPDKEDVGRKDHEKSAERVERADNSKTRQHDNSNRKIKDKNVSKTSAQRVDEDFVSNPSSKHDREERVSSASSQEDRKEKTSRKLSRDRSTKTKLQNVRRPLPECPSEILEERKSALPPPRFTKEHKLERKKPDEPSKRAPINDFSSEKIECEERPKVSAGVPNIAARRKRRERLQESQPQFSPPSSNRKESNSALSCPSLPRKSKDDIIREHLKRKSLTHEERDSVDGASRVLPSQQSFEESESDVDDNPSSSHGKGSDVMKLINTLQATLKLDDVSKERTSPEDSVDIEQHLVRGEHSPSGRLKDRINRLKRECIEGVGLDAMQKAYKIIDAHPEEQAEVLLRKLMGQEKFDSYNGLIWQLKFCEEFSM